MIRFSLSKIVLVTIIFWVSAYGQDQSRKEFFTPQNRLKFGNHLFDNADYLRAAGEYQNYLKIINNDTVKFNLARCFRNMSRTGEALDNFKSLFFNTNLEDEARLEYLKTIFQNDNLIYFRELCTSPIYRPSKYGQQLSRLVNYSYLFTSETIPSEDEFLSAFENADTSEIKDLYYRKVNPSRKDPALAAIFSAIVPGAGKIYTENYGDGITSFIFTGLLTYLAVDNFNAGHDTRGWIFSGLAAYFYAGNIYGSAASAQIFNAQVQFNFNSDLKFFVNKKKYFLPEFNF